MRDPFVLGCIVALSITCALLTLVLWLTKPRDENPLEREEDWRDFGGGPP